MIEPVTLERRPVAGSTLTVEALAGDWHGFCGLLGDGSVLVVGDVQIAFDRGVLRISQHARCGVNVRPMMLPGKQMAAAFDGVALDDARVTP